MAARVCSAKPGMLNERCSSGVSIAPGQTQLQRMPYRAYSIAVPRVRLTTPAFITLYAEMP